MIIAMTTITTGDKGQNIRQQGKNYVAEIMNKKGQILLMIAIRCGNYSVALRRDSS